MPMQSHSDDSFVHKTVPHSAGALAHAHPIVIHSPFPQTWQLDDGDGTPLFPVPVPPRVVMHNIS